MEPQMTMKRKPLLAGLIGVLVGGVGACLAMRPARLAIDYYGPPRVTVMNATGGDITDVIVTLGTARQRVLDLKDGQASTVKVRGRFGECSTRVSWTDSTGGHDESAGGYMENCGFYRATVVLTPDGKAKAVCEIRESTPPSQPVVREPGSSSPASLHEPHPRSIPGRYASETESLGGTTTRWRLFLLDGERRRLVTEAIVEDGLIQTMMATPFGWGCTRQGYRDCEYLATVFCGALGDAPIVVNLEMDGRGQLTRDHKPFSPEMVGRLAGLQPAGLVVVAEIETPVGLQCVQDLVKQCVAAAPLRGLVLLPVVHNPARPAELPTSQAEETIGGGQDASRRPGTAGAVPDP